MSLPPKQDNPLLLIVLTIFGTGMLLWMTLQTQSFLQPRTWPERKIVKVHTYPPSATPAALMYEPAVLKLDIDRDDILTGQVYLPPGWKIVKNPYATNQTIPIELPYTHPKICEGASGQAALDCAKQEQNHHLYITIFANAYEFGHWLYGAEELAASPVADASRAEEILEYGIYGDPYAPIGLSNHYLRIGAQHHAVYDLGGLVGTYFSLMQNTRGEYILTELDGLYPKHELNEVLTSLGVYLDTLANNSDRP